MEKGIKILQQCGGLKRQLRLGQSPCTGVNLHTFSNTSSKFFMSKREYERSICAKCVELVTQSYVMKFPQCRRNVTVSGEFYSRTGKTQFGFVRSWWLQAPHTNKSISSRPLSTSAVHLTDTPATGMISSITAVSDPVLASNVRTDLIYPDFVPIRAAEAAMQYIHQLTGLPWWGTVILTAFLLRVVMMVPLTIHSFHNAARLQRLGPEVKKMAERLRKEVGMAARQFGWDKKRAKEEYDKNFKRLLKEMYVQSNCHPMKQVVVYWVQLPVWLGVSYALRNMTVRAQNPDMAQHTECSGLQDQGTAWFPDLTSTDSSWLLPVLMGTVTLMNIEMNSLNVPEYTKYRKALTFFLRGVALVFIPISSMMPCAMVLYWVSSATLTTAQNVLFEYSPFRRLVGLPKSTIESSSPVQNLLKKARARYFKR